jgi:transcriptional regulator with XRE-family HTH domain
MSGQADLAHKAVHHVDVAVGARIRLRRKLLGVTQQELAQALGLTFQQVQKYERGTNRVSASKLYEIARTLQAPVSFFFDEQDETAAPDSDAGTASEDSVSAFLMTTEGIELARLFPKIRRGAVRRAVLNFVRSAVGDTDLAEFNGRVLASTPP